MSQNMQKKYNVFASRNFRLVFYGALVSELGAILYSFAVSFYILEITENDAFLQGLYLALCGIFLLLFTPVGGVLGDRYNKAKIMYLCDYMKGGLILAATVLLVLFPQSRVQLVVLFALGIIGNAVSGVFSPAAGALFPHIVEEDHLQQANAYFSMKNALEGIVGVVLAGILYAALPIYVLFGIVGVSYVISGISEMLIRYDYKPSGERMSLKLALRDASDGLAYLKEKREILALIGAILFINFFFAPVTGNFLPFFIKTDLANAPSYLFHKVLTPELWSSVFEVCVGVTMLFGAAVLSARPQAEKVGRRTALFLLGIAGLVIGLTVGYWVFVDRGSSINAFLILLSVGCLMIGALLSFINVPINTVMMRIVDKDKLSKVNSITSIGSQGMIPIASVLAGAVLNTFGSTALLTICSLGFTLTALLMLFNRRVKEI